MPRMFPVYEQFFLQTKERNWIESSLEPSPLTKIWLLVVGSGTRSINYQEKIKELYRRTPPQFTPQQIPIRALTFDTDAERLERGGPSWLLKLRWTGTEMKGVLPWGFDGYKRFLFYLGCSSQPSTKYFFPHCTLLQFLCPRRPASWAGSRAGSPVS